MAGELADDNEIAEMVAAIETDESSGDADLAALLRKYPRDPRLHFMRGSILAGNGRAVEAHTAMSKAVELAPGFALARYQLGFFELTSGEAERALSTWGPLLALPEDDCLRCFAEGLTFLIRDEFDQAIERLEHGMTLNRQNPPMNNDIRLIVGECRKLAREAQAPATDPDGESSATSILLGRFGGNRTIN